VGVATRICSRLPVQKLLPRPQGPEHPGHWRSGQARAGMGLKLKEEAKNSKEESIKIFVAKCLLLARFNVHFVAFAGFNIHVAKYSTYKTFFFSIYSFDMQKLMSCFVG
jgi:hypothetical protein